MRGLILMVAMLALPVAADAQTRRPAAPAPAPAPPVTVRTWTSQTAVWVGDKFEYVIELRRAPNVEIFLDDLLPDKLHLDGVEVLDTATEHDASSATTVIDRLRYTLAAYTVGPQAVGIAAIPVRLSVRRPGQKAEDAMPAGEVTVPALHVGLRSTLTPTGEAVEIRDQRAVRPVPRRMRLAEQVGWALLAFAALPVLAWAVQLVRRARRARPRRPARTPVRQRRAALEEIRQADVATPAARRDAYAALDAWIRDNVQLPGGAAAVALTPEEIAAAVGDSKPAAWRDELERVLLECERAKYGPDLPPADRWPDAVDAAATVALSRSL
jgi:hypothetical protein